MSICFQVPTLLRLLKGIDSLPQGATGALVFTSRDAPQGTVLIEDNRVCWAAASNMERRLTDILRRQTDPPLRVDDFEAIYEECYRDKLPLGETLLERQIITSDGLWRAIRQHTAEAIAMLSTTEKLTPVWASNRVRRYDAQFTFSTAEILSSIGAFGSEAEAGEATRILSQITRGNTLGVAYLMEGPGLPIAQVSADSWKCQALVDLGEWARVAVDREEGGEAETLIQSGAGTAIKRAFHGAEIIYVRWSGRDGEKEPSEMASSKSVS